MPRLIAAIAIASVTVVNAHAQTPKADDPDALAAGLVRAMRWDKQRSERPDPGEAIRAYIAAGYVRAKPKSRQDYTDYRVVRRPAKLFGQELVVIEEEYPSKYIGCCVSPGIGFILRVTGDLAPLKEFASANGCALEQGQDVLERLRSLKVATLSGEFLQVSCRERDQPRN